MTLCNRVGVHEFVTICINEYVKYRSFVTRYGNVKILKNWRDVIYYWISSTLDDVIYYSDDAKFFIIVHKVLAYIFI